MHRNEPLEAKMREIAGVADLSELPPGRLEWLAEEAQQELDKEG
jgi:hypothetical protein